VDGARWVRQEILDRNPRADLRVIAVWFPNIDGDVRESWPAEVLDDPRVVHLWEEGQAIGRWYGARTRPGEDWTEWDAFFVYGPEARWSDGPPPHLAWGRTIVREREKLRDAVMSLSRADTSGHGS
jgi:hypothetical protein